MNRPDEIIKQHLIDPELCIRCNSCEETCPSNAVSNNGINYAVDPGLCDSCIACISPCPTGAINVWQPVARGAVHSVAEQLQWDRLPEPAGLASTVLPETAEPAVSVGRGAPLSAAQPVINVFPREHPALALVKTSTRLTAESSPSEIRHVVLDLGPDFPFLEGQSLGIIPPGLDANGRQFVMRLYSIASPRGGEEGAAGTLALTVKRVLEDHEGKPHHGICSNHVCDLRAGDKVEVVGPYGASYLMPDDTQANLMMICTGTGIAPMRGMLAQRLRRPAAGKQVLFYGGRTPEEIPYHDELRAMPQDFLDLNLAYSRIASQPKQYVQDLLLSRAADVARMLIDENTYIYLCGLKNMEAGVIDAFSTICSWQGMNWDVVSETLTSQHRLHIETY